MAKLYPPMIEGTIPAFCGTTLVVPFSMNRAVSRSEVGGFIVKIKTVNGNLKGTISAMNAELSKYSANATSSGFSSYYDMSVDMQATFEIPSSITFTVGQYYKVQLAYIGLDGTIGYYSTVGVVKYTTVPKISIANLSFKKINPHRYYYTGIYSQAGGDTTEKIYSSRFYVYDENKNLIDDTGDILHNITNDDLPYEGQEEYHLLKDLEQDKTYYIVFSVTTTNKLTISTQRYRITQRPSIQPETTFDLIATSDYTNGYVKLSIENCSRDAITGSFLVSRASQLNGYAWEELRRFDMHGVHAESWYMLDCIVEQGGLYKYSIQQYNENGVYSERIISNTVEVDFEDMFLFDGERQLRIKFNPKVSTFKTTLLESKQDTIGSKYPFISRNGNIAYKDFPISGLISYQMDENEMFIPKDNIGLSSMIYTNTQVTSINRKDEDGNIIDQIEPKYEAIGTFSWDEERKGFYAGDIKYQVGTYYYKNSKGEFIVDGRDVNYTHKDTFNYYIVKPTIPFQKGYYYHKYGVETEKEKATRGITYPYNALVKLNPAYEQFVENRVYYEKIDDQIYYKKVYPKVEIDSTNTISTQEKIYNTSTDLTTENMMAERRFKLEVLDWLNNGKVKLFRSPAEGNYIVRLMNVQLTPIDSLGRMLHTFQCNAYEIANFNFKNLEYYNLIDPTENILTEMKWKTIDFRSFFEKRYILKVENIDYVVNPETGEEERIWVESREFDSDKYEKDKQSKWVEIVSDPTYSIQFLGLTPGAEIMLNNDINNTIVIGATGAFLYQDNVNPIYSIKVRLEDFVPIYYDKVMLADEFRNYLYKAYSFGSLTYGYKEKKIVMFNQVSNIETNDVPIRQFIGNSYWTLDTHDLLQACQDVHEKILTIFFMRFRKRETQDIYIKYEDAEVSYIPIELTEEEYKRYTYYVKVFNAETQEDEYVLSSKGYFDPKEEYFQQNLYVEPTIKYTFYEDMNCKEEAIINPLILYNIRLQRNDYRYSYVNGEQYFMDVMSNYYAPYTKMVLDGYDGKIVPYSDDFYHIIFNDEEVVCVEDTERYYLPDTSSVKSVVANRGVISELSYVKQTLEYSFEETNSDIKLYKNNYYNLLAVYLAYRNCGYQFPSDSNPEVEDMFWNSIKESLGKDFISVIDKIEIQNWIDEIKDETTEEMLQDLRSLYKKYISLLTKEINNYKEVNGIK